MGIIMITRGREYVWWKGFITNKVKEHGLIKWKQGMKKNNLLKLYSEKTVLKKEILQNSIEMKI